MEKKMDVMKRIVELSETTLEGLEHVRRRTMEGHFEETAVLFTDVVSSFYEMEKALLPYMEEFKETGLEQKAGEVIQGMKLMLAAYEKEKEARPLEILQFTLLPRYRAWQEELRAALAPYTAS